MSKKLPDFSKMSDEKIADFWDKHDVTDYWDQLKPVKEQFNDKRPKKAISMRFDEDTLHQLKKIAEAKEMGYQRCCQQDVGKPLVSCFSCFMALLP